MDVLNSRGLESKFAGAMLGSALGDAIGEIAFMHRDYRGLISYLEKAEKLQYTDDTAMALGLAESLIRKGTLDEMDLGDTFRENFRREPWRGYASGPPTIFELVKNRGIGYSEAARSLFNGQGSLGNGAAMRIAPLGLFFCKSGKLYDQACASAAVTHAHPVGMDGAAVQAFAVARAATMEPSEGFLPVEFAKGLMEVALTPEIKGKIRMVEEMIRDDVSPSRAIDRIGKSVAVHESMPFALYSFLRFPGQYEDCLFCAVMHGGDRDTLGAMAGAVSGAYLGMELLPDSWLPKLENYAYIQTLALNLARMTRD